MRPICDSLEVGDGIRHELPPKWQADDSYDPWECVLKCSLIFMYEEA